MRRLRTLVLALLPLLGLSGAPAPAEEVVLGLSQDEIPITATFTGSEILVFGAVKRFDPLPAGPPLRVIVTVSGPDAPVIVRRKERRFGIWVNVSSVRIGEAPSFYAVASTGTLAQAISETEDLRHEISIPKVMRTVGAATDNPDAPEFAEALVRIRAEEELYQILENSVAFDDQTLFWTGVFLPPRLTEGTYAVRIFLTREREVVDEYMTLIDVRKVGLERWLHRLAIEQPLYYGLMALALAAVAGWGASAAARAWRG
ncbi:MAG: TIGR02186 family protein [Pseudomonadota bacterium]